MVYLSEIHAQPPLPLCSSFYLLVLSLAIFICSEKSFRQPSSLSRDPDPAPHTPLENTCPLIQQEH